jgi:magnesium chelatase family protein
VAEQKLTAKRVAWISPVAFQGIEVVDVQVQIGPGRPAVTIGGLPDKAVAESRGRVHAALSALALALAPRRSKVNLAPGDLLKDGSHSELASARGSSSPWVSDPPTSSTAIRPWASSASLVALIGEGNRARPGEVSLAQLGVWFLGEPSEVARAALEALPRPLEAGRVAIARANTHLSYPPRVRLVAAPGPEGRRLLAEARDRMRLSARGYHRLLRAARTLADLDGSEAVRRIHVGEALIWRRIAPGRG